MKKPILLNTPTCLETHGLMITEYEELNEYYFYKDTYFLKSGMIPNPTATDVRLFLRELIELLKGVDLK